MPVTAGPNASSDYLCRTHIVARSPKPRFLAIEQAKDEASPDQDEWLNRAKPCLAPKSRL